MANPIERIGAATPTSTLPSPASAVRGGRSFGEMLAGPDAAEPGSVIPERLRAFARSITAGERAVDRVIAQAAGGKDFTTPELIAIQARVYRYTQELELVSKLVDKACTGVKQTLQTQV